METEERKACLDLIRNEGDHIHNKKVLKCGGEMLLSRRPLGVFRVNDYGPCPGCYAYLCLEQSIIKHQRICPGGKLKKSPQSKLAINKGSMVFTSEILVGRQKLGNPKFQREVYPRMLRDETSRVAQTDHLIATLGQEWLTKALHNPLKRATYASTHMRRMARLLVAVRKLSPEINPETPLTDVIRPQHFPTFVQAALLCSCKNPVVEDLEEYDIDPEELKHPSVGIKVGYDLARVASTKLAISIQSRDQNARENSSDFLQLIKLKWTLEVTKYARVAQLRNQRVKLLPHPEDLRKVYENVKSHMKCLNLDPSTVTPEVYREVTLWTEARLLLHSRRRTGELEVMT